MIKQYFDDFVISCVYEYLHRPAKRHLKKELNGTLDNNEIMCTEMKTQYKILLITIIVIVFIFPISALYLKIIKH